MFTAFEALSARLNPDADGVAQDTIDERGRVIIAGIGRFGQVVNRMVRMSGISTVVLDADLGAIETMRRFGIKGFYGDPSRPEMLAAAGLAEASVLVVAVDDPATVNRIVTLARAQRPDLHIVARARDRVHVYQLYQAGANDIVRETFDSSIRAGRYVLENMGFSDYEAARFSQTYFRVDRAAMRDLAKVWVPGQPVHLNAAYIERARKLETQEFLVFRTAAHNEHAIPLCLVQRLEVFPVSAIEFSGLQRVIRYRGSILPLISTNTVLGYASGTDKAGWAPQGSEAIKVVVVSKSNRSYGIIVDEILDVLEVDGVIDDSVRDRDGLLGNLVLDQRVVVVVDALGIVDL
ncbi:MAG: hypothetical protein EBU97_07110, partial [Rhodobacteraceae bacterium]|nr:hypothetical protein [Paracoccaceae bacterium]